MLAFVGVIFSPWSLLIAAVMIAATLWQCFAHANATKIDSLATVTSPSSRLKHRLMIAWLHYLQPWARLRGRIKGYFSDSNTSPEGKQAGRTRYRFYKDADYPMQHFNLDD